MKQCRFKVGDNLVHKAFPADEKLSCLVVKVEGGQFWIKWKAGVGKGIQSGPMREDAFELDILVNSPLIKALK